MGVIVNHLEELMASPEWSHLFKSPDLVNEIMLLQARRGQGFHQPSVSDLRKALAEKGLDVDGSRKVLVARLQAAEDSADQMDEE